MLKIKWISLDAVPILHHNHRSYPKPPLPYNREHGVVSENKYRR